jgi:hypothetical protein
MMTPEALADFAFRAGRLASRGEALVRATDLELRDRVVDAWRADFVLLHDEAGGDTVALAVLAWITVPAYSPEGDLERMRPASELPC